MTKNRQIWVCIFLLTLALIIVYPNIFAYLIASISGYILALVVINALEDRYKK